MDACCCVFDDQCNKSNFKKSCVFLLYTLIIGGGRNSPGITEEHRASTSTRYIFINSTCILRGVKRPNFVREKKLKCLVVSWIIDIWNMEPGLWIWCHKIWIHCPFNIQVFCKKKNQSFKKMHFTLKARQRIKFDHQADSTSQYIIKPVPCLLPANEVRRTSCRWVRWW